MITWKRHAKTHQGVVLSETCLKLSLMVPGLFVDYL